MGNALYYVEDMVLYASTDAGVSWTASAITGNELPEGTASFAVSADGTFFALFVLNPDTNPSFYLSSDAGQSWQQLSLAGLSYDFTVDSYVNLHLSPGDGRLFLVVYELQAAAGTIATTIFTSTDIGNTWQRKELGGIPDKSFLLGNDTLTSFFSPLYGLARDEHGHSAFFVSHDEGVNFVQQEASGLPEGASIVDFAMSPSQPTTLYAVVHTSGTVALYRSDDGAASWRQIKTHLDIDQSFFLYVQVDPQLPDTLYLYTEKGVYTSIDGGANFAKLSVSLWEEASLLLLDQQSANRLYYIRNSDRSLLQSLDRGLTWESIAPFMEAAWFSQTQGTATLPGTDIYPHLAKPGDTIELEAKFVNTGNITWKKEGALKVGLYVYKDPDYSGPPEYNDPNNPALFGKSWFANTSWGPSADGQTPQARAALLAEDAISPGEVGTFPFSFSVPATALLSPAADDSATLRDERYIREDLTLAWGSTWMSNVKNGDPWQRAHIWIPVRIVTY